MSVVESESTSIDSVTLFVLRTRSIENSGIRSPWGKICIAIAIIIPKLIVVY